MQEYELRHLEKIREGLAECTVLLKSNGDFPLDEPCPIAAYGSGIRHTVKGGTGSGETAAGVSGGGPYRVAAGTQPVTAAEAITIPAVAAIAFLMIFIAVSSSY